MKNLKATRSLAAMCSLAKIGFIALAVIFAFALTSCPMGGDDGGGGSKKTGPDIIDLSDLAKSAGKELHWGELQDNEDEYLLIIKYALEIQGSMEAAKSLALQYVKDVTVTVNATIEAAANMDGKILIDLSGAGTFEIAKDAEIIMEYDGTAIHSNGTKIEVSGTIDAQEIAIESNAGVVINAIAAINGKVDSALKVANGAKLAVLAAFDTIVNNLTNNGTVSVEGELTNTDNTIYNYNAITIGAGGTLINDGEITNTSSGVITNNGTFNNLDTIFNSGVINNNNTGTFNNTGYIYNSGTITNTGTFNNTGTIYNTGGTITGVGGLIIEAIGSAAITVTAPADGEAPDTTATVSGTVNFSAGAVTWYQGASLFTGTSFTGGTQYTATVTLTAIAPYVFIPAPTAAINSLNAEVTYNSNTSITISYEFTAISYFTGSGTELYPYIITTPEQLAKVAALVNAGTAAYNSNTVYYKLINDIDLNVTPYNTGTGWTPIGTYISESDLSKNFQGNFDGNGKVVR